MKIAITRPVLSIENTPMKDADGQELTYRFVFYTSLNSQEQGEVLTAEDKAKMYQLTRKLYASKDVKITVDEAKLLKDRVAKFYLPMVYGRVCDLLEGEGQGAPEEDEHTDK